MSELIQKLTTIRERKGDLPVMLEVADVMFGDDRRVPLNNVEDVEDEGAEVALSSNSFLCSPRS